jgi:uncharacterized NAD(P)/FAD-binding protein YdhS
LRNTLIIVGGGFCGTVLAASLLRRPPVDLTNIVLIERGPSMGRGVAYAVRDYPFLLNVPAARLSADSQDPLQFLRFARRLIPSADGEDFLPRALYGEYMQDVLRQAELAAPAHVTLSKVFGEVRHISPGARGRPFELQLADGTQLAAERVVLAPGNPPPPRLPWAEEIRDHRGYRHDPWDLPKGLGGQSSILIVGNGLTMADAVLALSHDSNRSPMLHTLSRRGLIPLPQTAFRPSAVRGDGEVLLAQADSLRRVLAMTRELSREVEERGGDWREVVTFIRQLAPALWRRFPDGERRRFVRHLQAHWDTHRHRLPPQLAARIEALRRSGRMRVNGGRIESVEAAGDQLRVIWHRRGAAAAAGSAAASEPAPETLTVDLLVNAMGPDYVLKRSADPLMSSLRDAGLVSADALNLGVRTSTYGACVDAQGGITRNLYYLGPMLRADHWEATAAAELREHAVKLAAHLASGGAAT